MKRILVVTGTRADFGKLKPLMLEIEKVGAFVLDVFVTGMHMLAKYGLTCEEVEKAGFKNIYRFVNQNPTDSMEQILAKTVSGLSDYTRETKPDFILFHGDRVEALSSAIVGALSNILTGHIEGGELSGTIDESIRHATSKLSHVHFVANEEAKRRLIQLGEIQDNIFVIGSPDIDIMNSSSLPTLIEVKEHYDIEYERYAIVLLHSVTTEVALLQEQVKVLIDGLIKSDKNYIVIYPNNDLGSEIILQEYQNLERLTQFKLYPSLRFESFLTLLKNAEFIIGNSSAGVREAPHYGVPCINLGSRQNGRASSDLILNAFFKIEEIERLIEEVCNIERNVHSKFGDGDSAAKFAEIILSKNLWETPIQKYFLDI
jgi:UDP-N-acetylglucosamine 2-epimerase (hydrolysing)